MNKGKLEYPFQCSVSMNGVNISEEVTAVGCVQVDYKMWSVVCSYGSMLRPR